MARDRKRVDRPAGAAASGAGARWGTWQGWASVLLLFITLGIAVSSIEQARWISPQPALLLVLVLAMLSGVLLAWPGRVSALFFILGLLIGGLVTMWQASGLLTPSAVAPTLFHQLIDTLVYTRPNESTIHFATFLVLFVWLTGYISSWLVVRRQNAWVGVALGAAAILINMSYLTETYHLFLLAYLMAALLLLAQVHAAGRAGWFSRHGVAYSSRGTLYLMAWVLVIGLAAIAVAWQAPEVRSRQVQAFVSSRLPTAKSLEAYWINLFRAVPAKQPAVRSRDEDELRFDTPIDLSSNVLFVVTAKRSSYWRTWVYDVYTSRGWKTSPVTEQESPRDTPIAAGPYSGRSLFTYAVIANLKTDVMLSAGDILYSDTSVVQQALPPLTFDLDLASTRTVAGLPADVRALGQSLLAASRALGRPLSLEEIRGRLPADLTLTSLGEKRSPPTEENYQQLLAGSQRKIVQLTRVQGPGRDVIAVTAPRFFNPNQGYTITAGLSTAAPAELSSAGESYPRSITDRYLQLPSSLPAEVGQLAARLVRNSKSPYEKIMAARQHLSQMSYNYNAESESPPPGLDTVDYFLFSRKSGDCRYFASTMVVLLRAAGVPARLAIGYLPGDLDKGTGNFIIRASHYHAWPEVYFPGYGWVPFEATPISDDEQIAVVDEVGLADELEMLGGSDAADLPADPAAPAQRPFWVLVAALWVGVAALAVYYYSLRVFRGPDYASAVYGRLCAVAAVARLGPRPYQTPFEFGYGLASAIPQRTRAVDEIVDAYVMRRFAGRGLPGVEQRQRLLAAWREVYSALLGRVLRLKQGRA